MVRCSRGICVRIPQRVTVCCKTPTKLFGTPGYVSTLAASGLLQPLLTCSAICVPTYPRVHFCLFQRVQPTRHHGQACHVGPRVCVLDSSVHLLPLFPADGKPATIAYAAPKYVPRQLLRNINSSDRTQRSPPLEHKSSIVDGVQRRERRAGRRWRGRRRSGLLCGPSHCVSWQVFAQR